MLNKRITAKQAEIFMKSRKDGGTQIVAAAKAGISERSGRDIENGDWELNGRHHDWRTRPDPLDGIWKKDLEPMLCLTPSLSPITLLEVIQEKYPEQYSDKVLRTLQRRVKKWKALSGPEKEVIFRQIHEPGRLGLSDFTLLKKITVTIQKEPLEHLLYHFRLAYSGWSYMNIILGGESYAALAESLQNALWRLGGSPKEHRTDSLSAAFKNLSKEAIEDITERYNGFCQHYGMLASRNNPGVSHENGSIESPHGHLKRRIYQAFLLRGSYDFHSIEEYQTWIDSVVGQHNRRNAKAFTIDREALQALPNYTTADYIEVLCKVTTSSTIEIKRVLYTVPSRLQGETLRIHLYHNRLACFLGATHIIDLKRIYRNHNTRKRLVDYRHVIKSLVRKPQAFRYSQLRDDLLPNDAYKKIWHYADKNMQSKVACKFIVGLLYLAAEQNCEAALASEALEMIAAGKDLELHYFQRKYQQQIKVTPPNIDVTQHVIEDYNFLIPEVFHA